MRKIFTCLFLIGLTTLGARAQTAGTADKLAEVNSYIGSLVDKGFTGAILLAKDGKPVLRRGIGMMDRATKRSVTPDTGFDIGSITKVFTSAAIFKLEQEGRLSVNDPISRLLKNVPPDKSKITVLQLVTHSSGLADLVGADGAWVKDYTQDYDFTPVGRDEIIRRAMLSKLVFEPGTGNQYSNTGYSLLAAIIEKVSGTAYEKYVQGHIFKPAGMKKTGYLIPGWTRASLAKGYLNGSDWGTPLDHAWLKDGPSWNLRGNGGMLSDLDDMLKWSQALKGDAVLGAKEREAYFAAMNVRKNKRGVKTMGAAGSNDVFTSTFLWVLDEDRLIVIFSNDSRHHAERYAGDIAGIMFRSGL